MQNKHGGSIRSHDCYLKKTVKNSLIQYSFYVMDSRVSSNCTRNIHRLATPEKEVNRKENTVGKISKLAGDRFVSLHVLRYRSWRSSIPLRNVLRRRK